MSRVKVALIGGVKGISWEIIDELLNNFTLEDIVTVAQILNIPRIENYRYDKEEYLILALAMKLVRLNNLELLWNPEEIPNNSNTIFIYSKKEISKKFTSNNPILVYTSSVNKNFVFIDGDKNTIEKSLNEISRAVLKHDMKIMSTILNENELFILENTIIINENSNIDMILNELTKATSECFEVQRIFEEIENKHKSENNSDHYDDVEEYEKSENETSVDNEIDNNEFSLPQQFIQNTIPQNIEQGVNYRITLVNGEIVASCMFDNFKLIFALPKDATLNEFIQSLNIFIEKSMKMFAPSNS